MKIDLKTKIALENHLKMIFYMIIMGEAEKVGHYRPKDVPSREVDAGKGQWPEPHRPFALRSRLKIVII